MKFGMACLALLFPVISLAAPKPCTKQDAIAAEEQASSIKSWTDLHRSFERFGQCDDGAIGEGYSDSIARLLADKWASLNELSRLTAQDRGFERFVLKHVDELMTPEQANAIRDNAANHCPSHESGLCKKIIRRLEASAARNKKP